MVTYMRQRVSPALALLGGRLADDELQHLQAGGYTRRRLELNIFSHVCVGSFKSVLRKENSVCTSGLATESVSLNLAREQLLLQRASTHPRIDIMVALIMQERLQG